ncbi:uncharacterized protein ARMOST_15677 [Armillaria ostoyae]|uniref:Uncharacterized protein n=1 Tax=Armillaria ostoyae TaxID=47428 RepID=A0A284RU09_ARMOS|nr:uncharacterized protein ARMOST_15677 [Armillaria ostoyae]
MMTYLLGHLRETSWTHLASLRVIAEAQSFVSRQRCARRSEFRKKYTYNHAIIYGSRKPTSQNTRFSDQGHIRFHNPISTDFAHKIDAGLLRFRECPSVYERPGRLASLDHFPLLMAPEYGGRLVHTTRFPGLIYSVEVIYIDTSVPSYNSESLPFDDADHLHFI